MTTVMVVDDATVPREAMARLLRKEGYETITAEDGFAALNLLRKSSPDLILLDVQMPHLDGLELFEALQDDPRWESIPVVMLTACGDTHCISRAEQLGAKAYLIKASHSLGEVVHHVRSYTKQN